MLNILQITPAYKPAFIYGGPTLSVSKLCEVLQASSLKVTVLTTTANGKQELEIETNQLQTVDEVDVYYFKRYSKDHTHFSPGLLMYLLRNIKKYHQKPNGQLVVHIHSWWNTVAVLSAFIAWCYHVPVVVSPRGMLTPYSLTNRHSFFKTLIHHALGKRLLRNCFIHATTEKEKADLNKVVKTVKGVYIIPNFALSPVTSIAPKPIHHQKNTLKLLFLSRIEEKKGLNILFTALAELELPWHLTIAGSGAAAYLKQLKVQCNNLNIAKQLTWVGEVKNDKKYALMKSHDLFMLTSHNENFANVVIESLAVGTAVVISEDVGLAPFVQKNQLGWVCSLTTAQLTSTIRAAAADCKKREWIRKHAPDLIETEFSDKKLLSNYNEMYHQIIAHGH